MPILTLALRSWLRHVAPLTLVSAVVMSPLALYAFGLPPAGDLATAKMHLARGYELTAVAWMLQLVLVGGVTPAVLATAGTPATQIDVLARGLRRALCAVVPCALAACAITVGMLAIAVPGLVLLALLAPVAATGELAAPLPGPLTDAVAVARRDFATFAVAMLGLVALDAAIPLVAYALVVVPLPPKNPPADALAHATDFVRWTATGFIALSPLPACAIAAAYVKSARRSQDPPRP